MGLLCSIYPGVDIDRRESDKHGMARGSNSEFSKFGA